MRKILTGLLAGAISLLGCGSEKSNYTGFHHYGNRYECQPNGPDFMTMSMSEPDGQPLLVGWKQLDERNNIEYLFREYHSGNLYRKTPVGFEFVGNLKTGRKEEKSLGSERDKLLEILYAKPMEKCEEIFRG